MSSIYRNSTGKCDICKTVELKLGNANREYKQGSWTGRWICNSCKHIQNHPKKEKTNRQYNLTNTCSLCGNKLIKGYTYKIFKEDDSWTGKWMCKTCYNRDYNARPYSTNNIIKSIRNIRTGNLDPNSNTAKGQIFEQVTCMTRGIRSLNIENDNYTNPFDHSKDFEYGILQTKGAVYNSNWDAWQAHFLNEHNKEFDNLIFYCTDEYMENIVRVYIFPREEIIKRSSAAIYSRIEYGWYVKYRVDEQSYNENFQRLRHDLL